MGWPLCLCSFKPDFVTFFNTASTSGHYANAKIVVHFQKDIMNQEKTAFCEIKNG